MTVTVQLGTPRFGVWCQRCNLPSAWEVSLYQLTDTGVKTAGTLRRCTEHNAEVAS